MDERAREKGTKMRHAWGITGATIPSLPLLKPRGVLLSGPPGTGKSLLIRRLLDEAREGLERTNVVGEGACRTPIGKKDGGETSALHVVRIDGALVSAGAPGQIALRLRDAFREAESFAFGATTSVPPSPPASCSTSSFARVRTRLSVIVIDDIDALCPSRGETGGGAVASRTTLRATGQLLTLMDGMKGVEKRRENKAKRGKREHRETRGNECIEEGYKGGREEAMKWGRTEWVKGNRKLETTENKGANEKRRRPMRGCKGSIAVIATTNRPDALDPALRRPGRFGVEICLSPPDAGRRFEIFKALLVSIQNRNEARKTWEGPEEEAEGLSLGISEELELELSERDDDASQASGALMEEGGESREALVDLSRRLVGFVGADIEAVVREASIAAVARVLRGVRGDKRSLCSSTSLSSSSFSRSSPPSVSTRPSTYMLAIITLSDLERAAETVGASALRGNASLVEVKGGGGKKRGRDWRREGEAGAGDKQQTDHKETKLQSKCSRDDADFSELGGLHAAKQQLRTALLWPSRYARELRRLRIRPTRGLLLHGPPGNGKTHLVASVAELAKCTLFSLRSSDVFGPYVGEAEAAIRRVFRAVRGV